MSLFEKIGLTRSKLIAGGLYMSFQTTAVAVVLNFQLIPFTQMGIRSDTLLVGIIIGVVCQLPLIALGLMERTTEMLVGGGEQLARMANHARLHGYLGAFDAPIAELFWSGIILSSIIAFLSSLGLEPMFASILGLILGTCLHLCSHIGPLQFLVGDSWIGFFVTMLLNRTAFIASNNIVAPILGHFLGSWFALILFRLKGIT